jgi:prevent-host-death family protein
MDPPWDLRRRVDEADFGDAELVTVKDLRIGLSEILNRVAYRGAQVVVRRHGRPVVAIVPLYDLQACQALEAHSSSKVEERRRLEYSVGEMDGEEMDENSEPWNEVTDKYGPW